MRRLQLPAVHRIQRGPYSEVEPPLEQHWDEATKLAWHAAVVAYDTGLTITLHDEAWTDSTGLPRPGWYGIGVGRISCSAVDYRDAWAYLNGVDAGARASA